MRKPRTQTTRRALNDKFYGFSDPAGVFSWSKFVGVWAQIFLLFQMGRHFEELMNHSDTLLIIILALIAPELLKKAMSMRAAK